jgi:acyl-CoA synthetase (AMP-forming)/AMP-acid ligase II
MPWKSRWSIPIPILSLPTYLFQTPDGPLPDKPILIDAAKPEYYLTHHTYREWCKRFAAGLLNSGFKPGERLLLYSGNTLFFPVVLHGTVLAGGIFTGANPTYVARELAYQLQDSGATVLVCGESSLDTAMEAASSIDFPREQIFVMGDGYEVFEDRAKPVRGIKHWTSLLASPSEGSAFRWQEFSTREEMHDTAVLNYSSGTTGLPKGVEISHLNYISNCVQTEHTARLSPTYDEYLKRAVALGFLPMYHAYGQTRHSVSNVLLGIPTYIMRKFEFLQMLEYVQKYRVTALNLVPPVAVALTKRPEVKNYDLSSVEAAMVGAAPLDPATIEDFNRMFKARILKQGWGMTEITCSACGWDPNSTPEASKVGELNANIEAMIVDDSGNEVADGERGELWVRGPNVMKGYWRRPEATKETVTEEGWLKTGDVAVKWPEGTLSIVDRKKELIKVKGNQVAPAELEGVLLEHERVSDAAVVGVTM